MAISRMKLLSAVRGNIRGLTMRQQKGVTVLSSAVATESQSYIGARKALRTRLWKLIASLLMSDREMLYWICLGKNSGRSDKAGAAIDGLREKIFSLVYIPCRVPYWNMPRAEWLEYRAQWEVEYNTLRVAGFADRPVDWLWDNYQLRSMHPYKYSYVNSLGKLTHVGAYAGIFRSRGNEYNKFWLVLDAQGVEGVDGMIRRPSGLSYRQCYGWLVLWAPWLPKVPGHKLNCIGVRAHPNTLPGLIMHKIEGKYYVPIDSLIPNNCGGTLDVTGVGVDPNNLCMGFGFCLDPSLVIGGSWDFEETVPGNISSSTPSGSLSTYLNVKFKRIMTEDERKNVTGGLILSVHKLPDPGKAYGYGKTTGSVWAATELLNDEYRGSAGDAYLVE